MSDRCSDGTINCQEFLNMVSAPPPGPWSETKDVVKQYSTIVELSQAVAERCELIKKWLVANGVRVVPPVPTKPAPSPPLPRPSSPTVSPARAPTPPQPRPPSPPAAPSATLAQATGPRHEIAWEKIVLGEPIGKGSFGVVHKATVAGVPVAVKVMKEGLSGHRVELFLAEIDKVSKVRQVYAVQFLGTSLSGKEKRLVIVTELMKGDLHGLFIREPRPVVSVEKKLHMLREVALGLRWLHEVIHAAHHDLKPENIMYDDYGRVKLGDFGLTVFRERDGKMWSHDTGSPMFAAPEVLRGDFFDEKSDIFSFGLVMYEVMYEKRAYPLIEREAFIDAVITGVLRPQIPPLPVPPPGFVELMKRCWSQEAKDRPTSQEVVTALDRIIISRLASNEKLTDWWVRNFSVPGDVLREAVSLGEFSTAVHRDTGFDPARIKDELSDMFCVSWDTHEKIDVVQLKHVDLMVSWFGDFFASGPAILEEMAKLLRQDWFHWDITSSVQAERRLMNRPFKTFLIRASFSNPSAEPFTLSITDEHNSVEHHRIKRDMSGRYRLAVVKEEDSAHSHLIQFNNLEQFVESQHAAKRTSLFFLSLGCPRDFVKSVY